MPYAHSRGSSLLDLCFVSQPWCFLVFRRTLHGHYTCELSAPACNTAAPSAIHPFHCCCAGCRPLQRVRVEVLRTGCPLARCPPSRHLGVLDGLIASGGERPRAAVGTNKTKRCCIHQPRRAGMCQRKRGPAISALARQPTCGFYLLFSLPSPP